MIEDEIYKTSTQFRIWSYSKDSLRSQRAKTNAVACERLRAAQNRARETPRSATPSTSGNLTPNPTDNDSKVEAALGKDVECLSVEEELMFVRYYCEQALELGDNYKPPLPTTVRVRTSMKRQRKARANGIFVTGDCYTVSSTFLSFEFSYDLPSQDNHALRAFPRHQNRQLLSLIE